MSSSLPYWVAVLQALLVPVLACFGVYIAWRQFRTASDKLRLDLFDRRMKVYEGTRDFIAHALVEGSSNISKERKAEFYRAMGDSVFLFDERVSQELKKIADAEESRRWNENRAERTKGDTQTFEEEIVRAGDTLRDSYENLQKVFREYLDFGHIVRPNAFPNSLLEIHDKSKRSGK